MENKIIYPNLEAELARNGISKKKYSEVLGIPASGITLRMQGKIKFTLPDIKKTIELLNRDFEFLFKEY